MGYSIVPLTALTSGMLARCGADSAALAASAAAAQPASPAPAGASAGGSLEDERPTVFAFQLHQYGRRRNPMKDLLSKDKDNKDELPPTLHLSLAVHRSKLPPKRKPKVLKLTKRPSLKEKRGGGAAGLRGPASDRSEGGYVAGIGASRGAGGSGGLPLLQRVLGSSCDQMRGGGERGGERDLEMTPPPPPDYRGARSTKERSASRGDALHLGSIGDQVSTNL